MRVSGASFSAALTGSNFATRRVSCDWLLSAFLRLVVYAVQSGSKKIKVFATIEFVAGVGKFIGCSSEVYGNNTRRTTRKLQWFPSGQWQNSAAKKSLTM